MMSPEQIRAMLSAADAAFRLGGQLLTWAQQRHPELRTEDPGPLEEVEAARDAALKRSER